MNKSFILALVLVLVMALTVPAIAAPGGSPTATPDDLVPPASEGLATPDSGELLVSAEAEGFTIVSTEQVDELPEKAQKTFTEAKEALETVAEDEPAAEGMAVRYFFYCETEEPTSIVLDLTDYTATMEESDNGELMVMQYVNGKWIALKYTINPDGTITVHGVTDAPMAIFVKVQER